jgi:protein ImuB
MERSDWSNIEAENAQRSTSNAQRLNAEKSVQETLTILHKWGIHTLGQLAALDKEQLGARLGSKAIRMWERANGASNRLLKLVQLPESFEESFEFENEIETAQPLLFILRRFLEQLALRLSSIYLVAKELTLQITFADKQVYERVFKIPQPTNDVGLLFRMLQTHLENFRSEHPIIAVALIAQPSKPPREQFEFFETTLRNPHQLSETLPRLTALLGADRVGTPFLQETHQPDAFHLEPFAWQVGAIDLNRPRPIKSTSRIALRKFRPAVAVSVLLDADMPAHVRSPEIWGTIIEERGPYLISGNWWDEKSWTRGEWDLQLETGELVRCHESGETWKIDGIYD